MPKVSLIIPIYNVEKYLPQCIESVQNQTLKDIEIILVDDGSPDSCGKIADEYAKKDDRIKVIHQENKWLGGARNSGLKIAKGEYISCIDADDYIAPSFCEKLNAFSIKENLDIVSFPFFIVNNAGKVLETTTKEAAFADKSGFYGDEVQKIVFPKLLKSYDLNFNVCFFSRKIIDKGFLFDEDIRYAEDYEAALRVYKLADSVGYLNEPLYYYRQNDESIMHVIKFERLGQIIHLFDLREAFIKENGLETPENLYNSAHLLIKLLIEKFPFVFGTKDKKYSLKKREIKETLKNKSLKTALSRIKLKNLDMGLFGKLCLIGLKLNLPSLIVFMSKRYLKKSS
ncbi:MAG: glycosyltransferase family 2 protein [Clostridia bacterium]|nr:glycosyltransferase family 2 protein [Clostridia bacterium]